MEKILLRSPRQVVIKYKNPQLRFLSFVCTGGALSRQECGLHKLFIKCLVLEEDSRENGCCCTLWQTSFRSSMKMVFDLLNTGKKKKICLRCRVHIKSWHELLKFSDDHQGPLCHWSFQHSAIPFNQPNTIHCMHFISLTITVKQSSCYKLHNSLQKGNRNKKMKSNEMLITSVAIIPGERGRCSSFSR